MPITKKYNGRVIKEEHSFKVDGTFQSFYAALRWCKENGYEEGSMCSPMPIAIIKGEYSLPEKWKNMSKVQRDSVDGIIVSNNFREGEVIIYIFN